MEFPAFLLGDSLPPIAVDFSPAPPLSGSRLLDRSLILLRFLEAIRADERRLAARAPSQIRPLDAVANRTRFDENDRVCHGQNPSFAVGFERKQALREKDSRRNRL
jgi:hypothetical protein